MSSLGALNVSIGGDTSSLSKSFAEVSRIASEAAKSVGSSAAGMGAAIEKSFDKASASTMSVGDAFKKVGLGAGLAFAAGAAAIHSFVEKASAVEETSGMIDATFGKQGASVRGWAKTFATASARSENELLRVAAGAQAMLSPILGAGEATASMSKSVVGLASDMGSFFNASDTDTMEAIRGGLMGHSAALQKYGVSLSDATMKQFLHTHGIKQSFDAMTEAQKVQARYLLIVEQTSQAHGAAAKSSQSWASATNGIKSVFSDVQAQLGQVLLPLFTRIANAVLDVATAFRSASPGVKSALTWILAGGTAFAGLVAGVAGVTAAMPLLEAGFAAVSIAASAAWTSILWPLLIAAGAIASFVLVIGAFRMAWDSNLGGVRDTVKAFGKDIIDVFSKSISWVTDNWKKMTQWLTDAVIKLYGKLKGKSQFQITAELRKAHDSGFNILDTTDAKKSIDDVLTKTKNAAKGAAGDAKSMFDKVIEGLTSAMSAGAHTLGDVLSVVGGPALLAKLQAALGFNARGGSGESGISAQDKQDMFDNLSKDLTPETDAEKNKRISQQDAAMNEGKKNVSGYFASDAGKRAMFEAQGKFTQMGQAALACGTSMLSNISGPAGSVVSAFASGFSTGGPIMGAVQAGFAVLSQSKGFQDMMSTLGNVVTNLAACIMPLFDGIKPLMQSVGLLAAILGVHLKIAFSILGKVVEVLAPIIKAVAWGFAKGMNWFLDFIAEIVSWFSENTARDIRKMKINLDSYDKAGDSMLEASKAADTLASSLTNVPAGFKVNLARFNATIGEGPPDARAPAGQGALPAGTAATESSQAAAAAYINNIQLPGGGKTIGQIVIQANDSRDMLVKVKQLLADENYRLTGSTQSGGPNAVARI